MTIGIVGNPDKPGLSAAVAALASRLASLGVPFVIDRKLLPLLGQAVVGRWGEAARDLPACIDDSDLLIAFGGDGTMLGVAREIGARGTPLLGVNLGKLGFLAELNPDELEAAIPEILAGKFPVEDRTVLEATTPAMPGARIMAINDIVIDKSHSPRLIDLETYIDGAFAATYRGDGLIVSTPTGSTAYALSNGGPIVTPGSDVLGITPISPHTLGGRPLIIPEWSVIRIVAYSPSDEVMVSADGKVEVLAAPPLEITIRRAAHSVRLLRRPDQTYFDVLRAKLLWVQDARKG
ncbi:MAG: kinase [Bacteroidetes bacterium]|nr:kinase [Bacteroidota bacterium]